MRASVSTSLIEPSHVHMLCVASKDVHATCHMHAERHTACNAADHEHNYACCKPPLRTWAWCILCRVRLDWKFATLCKPGETMGDMPFALYAPDMYQVPPQYVNCCL